eukprot:2826-Heterococcus_DN1.PRE.1
MHATLYTPGVTVQQGLAEERARTQAARANAEKVKAIMSACYAAAIATVLCSSAQFLRNSCSAEYTAC